MDARENAKPSVEEPLRYAAVLTEIGELYDAELAVAEALERQPENLGELDLLAKIKHMRGELSAAIVLFFLTPLAAECKFEMSTEEEAGSRRNAMIRKQG